MKLTKVLAELATDAVVGNREIGQRVEVEELFRQVFEEILAHVQVSERPQVAELGVALRALEVGRQPIELVGAQVKGRQLRQVAPAHFPHLVLAHHLDTQLRRHNVKVVVCQGQRRQRRAQKHRQRQLLDLVVGHRQRAQPS